MTRKEMIEKMKELANWNYDHETLCIALYKACGLLGDKREAQETINALKCMLSYDPDLLDKVIGEIEKQYEM